MHVQRYSYHYYNERRVYFSNLEHDIIYFTLFYFILLQHTIQAMAQNIKFDNKHLTFANNKYLNILANARSLIGNDEHLFH